MICEIQTRSGGRLRGRGKRQDMRGKMVVQQEQGTGIGIWNAAPIWDLLSLMCYGIAMWGCFVDSWMFLGWK